MQPRQSRRDERLSDALFEQFAGRSVLGIHCVDGRLVIDFGYDCERSAMLNVGVIDGRVHCVTIGGPVSDKILARGRELAKEHGW